MRYLSALVLSLSIFITSQAQNIFTYGNNTVSKAEFLKAYEKNNADKKVDYSEASVRNYIDLYSLYKMKVKEAEQLQMDTLPAIKNELSIYKMQLAHNYLADKETTDKLQREAYERMKEEIHVAHILVSCRSNDDTVVAYKKIDSLYKDISSGKADFSSIATKFSDDKGSAANGGDIGYITALQVVYPFENAAYATPVGSISKPFRTQFGYHIIKVLDRRPSQGTVEVQQILIATSSSKGAEGDAAAKAKAEQIINEYKSGSSFESLVQKYSDDKFTKNNAGKMEAFGVGRMTPEYEAAAFALKNPGDISQPVKTSYGYHILKLVKKNPLAPFDEIQPILQRRLETDTRSSIAKDAYQKKVEKELNYKEYHDNYQALVNAIPDSVNKITFTAAPYATMQQPVFELKGKKYSQADFTNYIAQITRGKIAGKKDKAFSDFLNMYKSKVINDIQTEDLEKNNAEFKNLMTDYHDGTLLFALMDKEIWSRASSDSVGLRNFYESNKSKYNWAPGFDGVVYQSSDLDYLKKFRDDVNNGTTVQNALDKINTDPHPEMLQETHDGRFEFTAFPQLQPADFAEGKMTRIVNDNKPGTDFVIYVRKLFSSAEPKTMDDARGPLVSDYQDFLEKEWNAKLKSKYPLKVDEKVLKSIVK